VNIAEAYLAACLAELDALKPGNVHRHAAGHGMTVADFETSARVSAPAVGRQGVRVGERVYEAVLATRAAVGQNTNLGIILLCAPLAAAAERAEPLSASLAAVLGELDLDDARAAFAAIAAANPGGLGTAPEHDVRASPTVGLREAMAAVADRDLVARQYANDFREVFGLGHDVCANARSRGAPPAETAEAIYLAFLTAFPDSHIARKFGAETAEAVRRDAVGRALTLAGEPTARRLAALAAWDAALKERGLNPGACADLTVATLFVDRLATNGLPRPSNND
jgi:triphosphoribosyl-dephospho-CoA synthase